MIDGIKILVTDSATVQRMAGNPLFNFTMDVSEGTGEMTRKTAKYKGLELIIYASGKAIVKGSLHKFYNDGRHNFNDFNRNQLRESLINLELIFGCEILASKIENLEFGVNVKPAITTGKFMQKITMYGRKTFKDGTFADSDFKEVDLQQFYLKAYDKGRQYKRNDPIFRFEYKSKKMQPLNDIGLNCLGDLLKDEIYTKLGRILVDVWEKILFLDDTIRAGELTPKQAKDLNSWSNPIYWKELTTSTNPKKFNQELDRFKKIVSNHSENVHRKTGELIIKKWEKLTTIPKPKNLELGKINPLYIGLKLPYSEILCKVTFLPIGMQKESEFLCRSGIRFYYENHSGIFKYYLLPRLSEKQKLKSLTAQFDEIGHSIRNEYFNKKHNAKKSIEKVLREPSIFDNRKLIDRNKLQIAGFDT